MQLPLIITIISGVAACVSASISPLGDTRIWGVSDNDEEWTSLVFYVSNGLEETGVICQQHSVYYCLNAYYTDAPPDLVDEDDADYHPEANRLWFALLIEEQWERINMINEKEPGVCCGTHVFKYWLMGMRNKQMGPMEYMAKLTDYTEHNKTLNYISVSFWPAICLNVILQVGFGTGELRRHHMRNVIEGVPYIILGREYGSKIGVPGIDSLLIEFADPRKDLTFHWFKHNIMCKHNPWICDEDGSVMETDEMPEASSSSAKTRSPRNLKKKGNRRGRRKNHSISMGNSKK